MRSKKWLAMGFLALSAAAMWAPTTAAQSSPAPGTGQATPAEQAGAQALSQDEKNQIRDIRKAGHQQVVAIRNDSSLTSEQRAARIREINNSSNSQIRGLLSPNQQRRFDRRVHQRHQNARHRHQRRAHRRNRA